MNAYDIIIVGSGPSALSLAQCCSFLNKNILIIDKESSIGGCHRVRRVPIRYNDKIEYVFTEHGPRVYSSSYTNFISLLKDIGINFNDIFINYNFSITTIGNQTIWNSLTIREILWLAISFFRIIFQDYGRDISVKEFTNKYNFSKKSKDILDKICRITDGASSDNYTLYQFLQVFNQQSLHTLYQPKKPNDILLLKIWKEQLEKRGVTFLLDTFVNKITTKNSMIESIVTSDGKILHAKQFILSMPPVNLVDILQNSNIKDAFGDFNILKSWSINTQYIDYISVTFHWDQKLTLPKIYGFPFSEWGIAFIVLTDYMTFEEDVSKTVISVAITIMNVKSNSNKLPNECSEQELFFEIYEQLKISFPNLPKPTLSVLSPGIYFDNVKKSWISKDTAFIATSKQPFLQPQSNIYKNLYTLGTHNGYHDKRMNFTSMESAVINGISLSHILYPSLQKKYIIQQNKHIIDYLFLSIIFICFIILYFI
jgi:protoporphyrinogen oxidase